MAPLSPLGATPNLRATQGWSRSPHLKSPQLPEKKIGKRKLAVCEWKRGNLIAIQLPGGDYVVFRMLHVHQDQGSAYRVVELFEWRGTIEKATARPMDTPICNLKTYGGVAQVEILGPGQAKLKDRIKLLAMHRHLFADPSRF